MGWDGMDGTYGILSVRRLVRSLSVTVIRGWIKIEHCGRGRDERSEASLCIHSYGVRSTWTNMDATPTKIP